MSKSLFFLFLWDFGGLVGKGLLIRLVHKVIFSAKTVHHDGDGTGCGDTCDKELAFGYQTCINRLMPISDDADPEPFLACWASFFDSDCNDCLCDAIYDNFLVL